MKLELRYDPKNKRLYADKPTIMVITFIIIITVILGSFAAYRILQDRSDLQAPSDENQPLTLGVAPVSPETIPPSKEAASDAVIAQIKKAHDNKFNIIFFYDGYDNQKDALLDIKVLEEALDLVEPFASLKEIIAFKIFTTEGQKCHVERGAKKILKCDKELVDSFNRLGIDHFKLVILSPLEFVPAATVVRGKNSAIYLPTFQGALTRAELNQFLGRFFVHELGHSLGLRDEYTRDRPQEAIVDPEAAAAPSSNRAYQPAKPNCAPDEATARNWWGEYLGVVEGVDIIPGCAGRDSYFYPQKGTLMSDNPEMESFGQVSEDYLRGVLSCFFGNKESFIFPAGLEATYSAKLQNCDTFRAEFPGFWDE